MKTLKNRQPARLFLLLAIIASFSNLIGCSKSSDYTTPQIGGIQKANEVWLQDMAFNPSTRTVPVNTTVTWTNKDSYSHTVTSDSTMFNSGNMSSKATFSFLFAKKGTYKYHCSIHVSMTGTIIVQ